MQEPHRENAGDEWRVGWEVVAIVADRLDTHNIRLLQSSVPKKYTIVTKLQIFLVRDLSRESITQIPGFLVACMWFPL